MKPISVFKLSHELSVDAQAILDRCRAEDTSMNDVSTPLTPEQAEMIRAWFRRYPIATNSGEPLSQVIIRERR